MKDNDAQFEHWKYWFQGIEASIIERGFEKWSRLVERSRTLHRSIPSSPDYLGHARAELEKASQRLKYDVPYKIAVLGETGAGKSSIVNSLLRRKILRVAAGGAVTGVPTYVYPASDTAKEYGVVVYRNHADFISLLRQLASRHQITLPDSVKELMEIVNSNKFGKLIEGTYLDENLRKQFITDCEDITSTWRRLAEQGRLNARVKFDPSQDTKFIQDLIDEKSETNTKGPAREIAGILRVEYHLRQAADGKNSLRNTIVVDTPGIGAQTMRHREILQMEAETADAVILVVNAKRPESQTVTMAHLLQDALFQGLSSLQRTELMGRIFLVVNQMDQIKTADDERRLRLSVDEIRRSLSADLSGGDSTGPLNYFETMAELAMLAQRNAGGESLTEKEQNQYLGYLTTLNLGTSLTRESDERAIHKSGIKGLEDSLDLFLGAQRIDLMLREAEMRLKNVIEVARKECNTILEKYNLNATDASDPLVLKNRYLRELCRQQVDEDRQELLSQCRSFNKAIYNIRRSTEHEQVLSRKVSNIFEGLDNTLRQRLRHLLASDSELIGTAIDDITGFEYREGRIRALLLDLEDKVRSKLEAAAREFAQYYCGALSLHSGRLLSILQKKSYDQTYIQEYVNPIGTLQEKEKSISNEFCETCRWVFLYEFIQRPLLDKAKKPQLGNKVWEVVRILGPALIQGGIEASAHAAGAPAGTASFIQNMVPKFNESREKRNKQTTVPPPPLPQQEVDLASQERIFLDDLENALLRDDTIYIENLVSDNFAIRYRSAVFFALPYVEDIFYYEIGKYRRSFEEVVRKIGEEHQAHLSSESPNGLYQVLMKGKTGAWNEINLAVSVIKAINELP